MSAIAGRNRAGLNGPRKGLTRGAAPDAVGPIMTSLVESLAEGTGFCLLTLIIRVYFGG